MDFKLNNLKEKTRKEHEDSVEAHTTLFKSLRTKFIGKPKPEPEPEPEKEPEPKQKEESDCSRDRKAFTLGEIFYIWNLMSRGEDIDNICRKVRRSLLVFKYYFITYRPLKSDGTYDIVSVDTKKEVFEYHKQDSEIVNNYPAARRATLGRKRRYG